MKITEFYNRLLELEKNAPDIVVAVPRNLRMNLEKLLQMSLDKNKVEAAFQAKELLTVTYWSQQLLKQAPGEVPSEFISQVEKFIYDVLADGDVAEYYFEVKNSNKPFQQQTLVSRAVLISSNFSEWQVLQNADYIRISNRLTKQYQGDGAQFNKTVPFAFRRFFLPSHKSGNLDTYQVMAVDENKKLYQQQDYVHVVYFFGNGQTLWDSSLTLFDLQQHLTKLLDRPVCVTAMNYRCVLFSEGKLDSMEDLFQDGVAIVNHLRQMGADPAKTILIGRSLGGAVAVGTAAHCHNPELGKEKFPVSVVNLCSFHHISHVVPGVRFLGGAIKAWESNIAKLYNTIPTEKKTYFLAKPNKGHPNQSTDQVISGSSSLHKGLKGLFYKQLKGKYEVAENNVTPGFNPKADKAVNKEQRKKPKLRLPVGRLGAKKMGLHMWPLNGLENRDGVDGQTLLDQFIRQQLGMEYNQDNIKIF